MVCENPDLIKGYKLAILTPNVVEFKRLCKAIFQKEEDITVRQLAEKYDKKNEGSDRISTNH